jgi:hypothetical protein
LTEQLESLPDIDEPQVVEPFLINLDAARAQRAEAGGYRYGVVLGGEHFVFPAINEWPVEITNLLQAGDLVGALKLLLPERDHDRFFARHPTMGDMNELFESLGKVSGVGGLGNSPRSGRSSRSTRKR